MMLREVPAPPVTKAAAAPDGGPRDSSQPIELNRVVDGVAGGGPADEGDFHELLAQEMTAVGKLPGPGLAAAAPPAGAGAIVPAGGKSLPLPVAADPRALLGSPAPGTGQAEPAPALPSVARLASAGAQPVGLPPAATPPTAGDDSTASPLSVVVPRGGPAREGNSPPGPEQPTLASELGARSRGPTPAAAETSHALEAGALSNATSSSLRADASTAAPARVQPGPVPSWTLEQPMRTSEWGSALGERVTWMTRQDVPVAQLRLNPPELGPLEVRIAVNNSEASIHFGVQHAAVRDAVDSAVPRLREMLANAGLQLVDVDVSGHDARRGAAHPTHWERAEGAADPSLPPAAEPVDARVALRAHTGFIDSYV